MAVEGIDGWESHEFEVQVELDAGRPVLVGIKVLPRAGQPLAALTIGSRRALPVGELARQGAVGSVDFIGSRPSDEQIEKWRSLGPVGERMADRWAAVAGGREYFALVESGGELPSRPRGGSQEFSEAVAVVFEQARSRGESGIRAVMDAWSVGRPRPVTRQTAENWIEEARPHRESCALGCKRHQGVMQRGVERRPVRKDGK